MADQILKPKTQDLGGWMATRRAALDAYWLARRNGKSENEAVSTALDCAMAERE